MTTRRLVGDPIFTKTGADNGAAFSADGRHLAYGDDHGIVVWDLEPQRLVRATCAVASRNLAPRRVETSVGALARIQRPRPNLGAIVTSTACRVATAAPPARNDRRRARGGRRRARTRAHRARARDVLGDVVRALLVQVVARAPRPVPDPGTVGARRSGRGRGCRRHRRRTRGRGAHREPQPPLGGRAVPGRGHRRRRDHPRHLLDGRPSDRAHGPAALRHARRRAHALPLRRRGLGHQRLRQLGRRADGRRRGRVRRHATAGTRS